MTHAVGEIRSLAQRAARGAGLPWGLAEEAGYAVSWLEALGAPGVEALSRLCDLRDLGGAEICPILSGAALLDGLGLPDPAERIDIPLLVLPFIAQSLEPGAGASVRWTGAAFRLGAEALETSGGPEAVLAARAGITIEPLSLEPSPTIRWQRSLAGAWSLARLERYAARMLAPSDSTSRAEGAGAGLVDRD